MYIHVFTILLDRSHLMLDFESCLMCSCAEEDVDLCFILRYGQMIPMYAFLRIVSTATPLCPHQPATVEPLILLG